jgi:hypothetical protein
MPVAQVMCEFVHFVCGYRPLCKLAVSSKNSAKIESHGLHSITPSVAEGRN